MKSDKKKEIKNLLLDVNGSHKRAHYTEYRFLLLLMIEVTISIRQHDSLHASEWCSKNNAIYFWLLLTWTKF